MKRLLILLITIVGLCFGTITYAEWSFSDSDRTPSGEFVSQHKINMNTGLEICDPFKPGCFEDEPPASTPTMMIRVYVDEFEGKKLYETDEFYIVVDKKKLERFHWLMTQKRIKSIIDLKKQPVKFTTKDYSYQMQLYTNTIPIKTNLPNKIKIMFQDGSFEIKDFQTDLFGNLRHLKILTDFVKKNN